MTPNIIRWRLNDPSEENRQRWTKVHRVSLHSGDLTACHRVIPDHPYMMDRDEWVPDGAPRCRACEHADHRER